MIVETRLWFNPMKFPVISKLLYPTWSYKSSWSNLNNLLEREYRLIKSNFLLRWRKNYSTISTSNNPNTFCIMWMVSNFCSLEDLSNVIEFKLEMKKIIKKCPIKLADLPIKHKSKSLVLIISLSNPQKILLLASSGLTSVLQKWALEDWITKFLTFLEELLPLEDTRTKWWKNTESSMLKVFCCTVHLEQGRLLLLGSWPKHLMSRT